MKYGDVTVDEGIAPPAADTERLVIVSHQAAPQSMRCCHQDFTTE